MTISAYGAASVATARADATYGRLKADLNTAQVQLSSGKVADTVSGLGADGLTALTLTSRLSKLSAYGDTIANAQLRVELMSTGLGQLAKLSGSLATSLSNSYDTTAIGRSAAQVSAQDGLRQAIEVLNTELGGSYLFAGRGSNGPPVAPADLLLNGDATHAGLKDVVAQRQAADTGPDGLGRLAASSAGTTATLSETAANLPFGLKVAGATSSGSALSTAVSMTSPARASITVGSQPAAGDTVTVTLGLPDGTTETVSLRAGPASGAVGTPFAIGATEADTAANIATALGTALGGLVGTTLPAASAIKAAGDFFAGTAGSPTMRVAGPPYATATSLVAGTAADTVAWYSGTTTSSPRDTAAARIGDNQGVALGSEASEAGFRTYLASLGALAVSSFPAADPSSASRYGALASRVGTALTSAGGTDAMQAVVTDLSLSAATMDGASDRLKLTRNQLQDALSGIQDADPTETSMKLLDTQTRLQASYQTTAAIGKLSLVNYL